MAHLRNGAGTQSRPRQEHRRSLALALRAAAKPLPAFDEPGFGTLFDRFADARVVLIGESTHGTSDFYRARIAITRRLIVEHGFNIVAIEGDWPDAAAVDRFVRGRPRREDADPVFTRFPTWMWRNLETDEFVQWLRTWNADRPVRERVEFRGLDMYSLGASIGAVLAYLDKIDPRAAGEARRRYGCLTPWQDEPAIYGRDVMRGDPGCEKAVIAQLQEMLEQRVSGLAADGEEFFDATQNARLVQAAESYYRVMYHGSRDSWNLRDRHMFDTLERALQRRGPDARAIIWAHNSHVGDAEHTEMGQRGEVTIGHLARRRWGAQAVLIGQGTDRGTVVAADDWGEPAQVKTVLPSRPDSWERQFAAAGVARSLTTWREDAELQDLLGEKRLERAIGVVYRPDSERHSHYFDAALGRQFDAWLWFENTTALTPLAGEQTHEMPDTWPFGL